MLENLKSNIARLIALYESERQRADGLAEKLQASEAAAETYRMQITELNGKIEDMKLANAFSGNGDPVAAKESISKLIREIDRCIKLLEK